MQLDWRSDIHLGQYNRPHKGRRVMGTLREPALYGVAVLIMSAKPKTSCRLAMRLYNERWCSPLAGEYPTARDELQ